jgi:hypothetical protein
MGGMVWPSDRATCALLGLVATSLTSSPSASRDKILTPKKSHINLSSGRSLKYQNMQNMVFLSYRVVTKIRAIDEKSPINQ